MIELIAYAFLLFLITALFIGFLVLIGVTVYSDIQKEKRLKEEHDSKYHHFK